MIYDRRLAFCIAVNVGFEMFFIDIIKVISNCSIASIVLSKFELLNEFINISKKYDAKVDLLVKNQKILNFT